MAREMAKFASCMDFGMVLRIAYEYGLWTAFRPGIPIAKGVRAINTGEEIAPEIIDVMILYVDDMVETHISAKFGRHAFCAG
jgi:hypothetical protein